MLRIGIEALHVNMQKITGIERYTLLVLEALNSCELAYLKISEVIIFTNEKFDVSEYSNLRVSFCITTLANYVEKVNKNSIDVLHCTFVPPEKNISCAVAYTLHDVGRYIYPDFMSKDLMKEHIKKLDILLKNNKCTLLTVSESSKKQVKEILNIPDEINFSAPLYVNNEFRKRAVSMSDSTNKKFNKIEGDYILVVGCFIPTKNVISIIMAYERCMLKGSISECKLIIVGKTGWDEEVEKKAMTDKNIIRLTDVTDEELMGLYLKCKLFVSASLIEGFGLPLIEAAYLKAPILCADIPPYHEILGDTGHYFSPLDIDELEGKIPIYLGKKANYSCAIEKFCAENMGKKLIEIYESTFKYINQRANMHE